MDDLISREAAIDAICSRCYYDGEPESYKTCEYYQNNESGFCDYMSAINGVPSAQPEQRKGKWIPCSERLPEDGIYLVYAPDYQGGSSSAKEWHDGVMFSKYKNGKWSIEHGYYSRPNCVIAWMPLPEPWECN